MNQTLLNDRYRLEEELGQGGMGTVHRAFDTTLEREVAVKLVTGYKIETEGRARLLQEAKSIAQLNHPNIVTVYDAGEVDEAPYIVMELIDGSSLHDRPPENFKELVRIARQICMALEHAHESGIIHRDLKPENVLIDAEGNAKLMDFGIARSTASRMTQEGRIEGTVFYMAPELALGQEYDGRSDLYALGVMLYELTTGELPFQHGDPVAVISQHVHAPVVPPRAKDAEIPPGLDRLIVQLMEKDPEHRPASAAQVLRLLEEPSLLDTTSAEEEQLSTLDRIVRGRMIGRESEFGQARRLWHSASEGEGQILLISGEPGVGKSRLLREIITQSEVMGAQVLGSASYAEGGPPYAPFKQILRAVLPKASQNGLDLPDTVVADLLSLAPEFRSQYPDVPPNPSKDPQSDQHRLFESFFIFVAALSQDNPLLIYLDDAHWADSGSLSLFRHLARQLGSQPIMLLATYREVELDEARPLYEVLLDLSREPHTTRIKLNRLTLSQTAALLTSFFQDEITHEFSQGIYRETDGNPFFIEEVCKALVESGKLYFKDGSWNRPSMDELGIPQSVRVAIQSRLGKLSPETQNVLNQAAVLGREFEFDTLALAAEADEDSLIDALEEADRAQIIEEQSENGHLIFAFSHALIPSTLVEGLRILQRRRLHRRAAAALEERDPENYTALGMHLLEAGQTEQGVDYLLLAGDQARALYAHPEAIQSYLQALDYAKETEDYALAARTLMKLGLTYHNAFEYEHSREAYEEGFVYWQRSTQGRSAEALPAAPHALRVASWVPPSLDPGKAQDNTSQTIISQLFSGLVELTPDLSIVPDVARSWDVLEGGRSYRFHLRDDVLWSDGRPLTARDFEFGWKRCLSPELKSEVREFLFDLEGASNYALGVGTAEAVGVRADGDHTLVVSLERPTGYFLQSLAASPFFPVPQHAVAVHGDNWIRPENIVSNGPFLLTAMDPESGITMKRNPDYHGVARGNVSQIEVLFARGDSGELYKRYEQDQLDLLLLFDVSAEEVDILRQRHPDEYLTAPVLGTSYVNFDVSRPPFDDARVRRAFCMAVDRESLSDITFRGYVTPADGGFVPPGMPGHVPGLALPYDPPKARQLLAEAGYADGIGFPNIECLSMAASIATQTQADLQSRWAENLGVEVTWEQMDWAEYLDRFFHEPPNLGLMGWGADYPDPDSFLRLGLKHVTEVWGNEPYDELMANARSSMDQASRIAMYEQAQGLLADHVPVFPLVYFRGHLLLKPWISQHPISPISWTFWKDVVIEPHD